ncbi:MAG: tRNA (adenosine(37)-N6)-threonylcarbamoyltransferase complex dimerization subunit type 1 TsaB [Gammaproteobacteria bacterium]|nr:tRNA (adenosine(37)-N6)-threonylcarbamoyltransferase complex dimerization subunit type 1 TsaB [Gammaproteobacteria bacterium]MCP5425518.1 tRNA (adenosine(37)-N6)-threonylcarbamoyltransferase complex dimerization subunit type 1 TsaB [Gammaproteobacteria bacterium]MCP5459362.1 tRNA (adenosine(37)-N6)-threonylcarbamoyltransferase complex dimerization subunit type 1 TsaB [Gammaproteobacteria bacterium]
MKLLALDTATDACSAAVLVDDEVIERYELAPRRHAELILPMLDALLADAGLSIRQLDGLAFGRGPGAFTGLRIATGVAQGIAFAADLPIAPISTLAAMAHNACYERGVQQVAVALDARMSEIYWGAYMATTEGDMVLLDRERVCRPADAPPLTTGDWFGAGSGWTAYHDILVQRLPTVSDWWGECYPRAGDIALLASLVWQRGQMVPAEQALPIYLRDEVAHKPPV